MKFYLLTATLLLSNIVFSQVPQQQKQGTLFGSGVGVSLKGTSKRKISISEKGKMYRFEIPNEQEQEYIYEYINYSKFGFIVKKDGKYGITDPKAQFKSKIEFDSIGMGFSGREDLYIVKKKGKYGLMDSLGNLSGKLNYDHIKYQRNGEYYLTQRKNQFGAIRYDGKTLMEPKFNNIAFCSSNFPIAFIKNEEGKLNMLDLQKKHLNPMAIDLAILYKNLIVVKENGKYGAFFVDSLGYTANKLPIVYDKITPSTPFMRKSEGSSEVLAEHIAQNAYEIIVEKDKKFSLVNNEAKPIVAEDFDLITAHPLSGGGYYYKLKQGNKYGAYFPKTKKMMPVEMDYIKEGFKDAVIVKKGQTYGVYSTNAELVIPIEYHNIETRLFGYSVIKGRKAGLFNAQGKLLVPAEFEGVSSFYDKENDEYFKVVNNELTGVYRVGSGLVIPVEYDFVIGFADNFLVSTKGEPRKQGILDKNGKVIIPVENSWIHPSLDRERSLVIVERVVGENYFYNLKLQKIINEPVSEFNFLYDTNNLIFIPEYNERGYLYVKNKNGKVGLLNIRNQKLDIPFEYDAILQKFECSQTTYLLATKGGKYGVVNEKNQIVIPFQYDYMNLDLMLEQISDDPNHKVDYRFVAVRNGKFGVVNMENKATVPFEYKQLERVAHSDLFKARKDNSYMLINADNVALNKGPFDEIGQFEFIDDRRGGRSEGMTFQNGEMRLISTKGEFISRPIKMNPVKGFKTFKELKGALIAALDSKDDQALKTFAVKVSPSAQALYYFQGTRVAQKFQHLNIDQVIEQTFQELIHFKAQTWNDPKFDRSILKGNTDYTRYDEGIVSSYDAVFNRYSQERFLERLLGECVKINGNWISTYFAFMYR